MSGHRPYRALDYLPTIKETIGERKPAFFLDFDGTLAPITSHPDLAALPSDARESLTSLARDHVVCLISGREMADLRRKVDIPNVYYAAEHGYRIAGPPESEVELDVGPEDRLELETASYELETRLRSIAGVVIETKGTSLSVHYRQVAEDDQPLVHQVVRNVAESTPGLELRAGKLVHELRPRIPWGKGRAVQWLLGRLRLRKDEACPVCLGDDLTDEDMFVAIRRWGIGVAVGKSPSATAAEYLLADHLEVIEFIKTFVSPRRHP